MPCSDSLTAFPGSPPYSMPGLDARSNRAANLRTCERVRVSYVCTLPANVRVVTSVFLVQTTEAARAD
jgi:hypothetical protein